ncbi:inositol monophosphatase family protein [Rhodococcus sp. G-MC3]|uniref:inositol monophosphatase family protein n=1 Tax=Rhodococcus sp. G-MC3 TaxID=3046209 RepID=UPI0024B8B273|nr:inositol monophosphatase family protein [Rhodococcus sp. G-MC3]MDJ0391730.1 inositol monophosphatase family protein [Rhodococcus sp. G-MC3]
MSRALLEVAEDVARAAAAHVRVRRPEVFGPDAVSDVQGGRSAVTTKSTPTDPVTIVDTETEEVLRGLLAERRPGDAILGEEGGGSTGSTAGVRWVLDPIDGTVNFLYGIPAYAISVAAQVDGVSVAGVVVDVARDIVYSALRGGGATATESDGSTRKLSCNPVADVSLALVATGFGYGALRRTGQGRIIGELLPLIRDIRRIGSAALDLCMVASGAVDAHFEHGLSPWDWAAGSLIAEEAGAAVVLPLPTSSSGEGAVTVAVAPGIEREFLELLQTVGAMDPIPSD